MAGSADFLINRRSRRAFCCAFPAFLLQMAQKQAARVGWSPGLTSEQPRRNPRLQDGVIALCWDVTLLLL